MLRLLTAEGVFAEIGEDRFANTPLSQSLRQDSASSQAHLVRFLGTLVYPAATQLAGAVRTGTPAFELAFGQPIFPHIASHPDHGEAVARGMAASARLRSGVALACPWPVTGTVVDVGGADGSLLAQILTQPPRLTGIVVDLPTSKPQRPSFDQLLVAGRPARGPPSRASR